jgi:virginiamycin B lyase
MFPSVVSDPTSIAAGPDGALWFTGNGLVGRITTTGSVTFFSNSKMQSPYAITAGPDKSMWFTDNGANAIGEVSTTAGNAVTYFTAGTVDGPTAIATGPGNTVWFVNSDDGTIGESTHLGVISNYSGMGMRFPSGIAEGSDGNEWFTNGEYGGSEYSIGQITPTGVVTIFPSVIDEPEGIAAGSDGALWFTNNGNNSIGRITTLGAVTNFSNPAMSFPRAIAAVPGGNLFFTNGSDAIASLTTAGAFTNYEDATIVDPGSITVGPNANGTGDGGGGPTIWFVNDNTNETGGDDTIGELTPTGQIKNFVNPDIGTDAEDIADGGDGALWFTNASPPYSIGRITPKGVVSLFTNTGIDDPKYIAPGPNKTLWFTQGNNTVGRITTAGVVTIFPSSLIDDPFAITAGPDHAMWFSQENDTIGRITSSGVVTTYPSVGTAPFAIVTGPDGAMWYTGADLIGRMTTPVTPAVTNFSPASGTAGPPATTVTITGQSLAGATDVNFNGTAATITSDSGNKIVVTVPAGATTGPISLTTPDGTLTTRKTFRVT